MTDGGDGSDDGHGRWRVSRRGVIGATAVGLIGGLAGCVSHHSGARLRVSIRDQFEATPPVSVPLNVSAHVKGVETNEVALLGVEVVAYGIGREPIGRQSLGDLSWQNADPEQRDTEEGDEWLESTVHTADWELEPTVKTDEVPEWITFDVEEVRLFAPDEESANSGPVGLASASRPPPDFSARIRQYDADRPAASTVSPDDYQSHRLTRSRTFPDREEGPLLPDLSPASAETETETEAEAEAEVWHDRTGFRATQFRGDRREFDATTEYEVEIGRPTDLGLELEEAFVHDRRDGPHFFEAPHPMVANFAASLTDPDLDLDVRPGGAFLDPAATAVRIGGRTIGVPHAVDTVALLYDRAVVEEPPETVADLLSVVEDHHDPESGEYGLDYPRLDPFGYSAWIHASGGHYFDPETGELGIADPGTVRGIEFVAEELAPYVPDDPGNAFAEGRAPVAVAGPGYASRLPDGREFGVTTLPTLPDGEPSPYVRVDAFAFTERMDQKPATRPAATSFAEWYATNEEILARNAEEYGPIPAHEGVIDDADLPATVQGFAASAETGRPEPAASRATVVYSRLQEALDAILAEEQSVEDALAEAEAGAKDDLGRDESQ